MVTAHPVPHHKREPRRRGQRRGSEASGPRMGDRMRPPSRLEQQELTKSSRCHGQCAPAALIHSEMRCTTMPSIPR
jgi:hypothetical protein